MRNIPRLTRLFGLIAVTSLAAQNLPFEAHTLATDLTGGYQVVACDVNNDGKPDLIALASGMSELVWYENPGWQKHVMAPGHGGNFCLNSSLQAIEKLVALRGIEPLFKP